MAEEQINPKTVSLLKFLGLLLVIINIFGCVVFTLLAPVLSQPARISMFVIMLIAALAGVVIGVTAATKRPARTVGVISLILCLTFGALWGFGLATALANPVDVNDTPE